jgi:hypothetical protein
MYGFAADRNLIDENTGKPVPLRLCTQEMVRNHYITPFWKADCRLMPPEEMALNLRPELLDHVKWKAKCDLL